MKKGFYILVLSVFFTKLNAQIGGSSVFAALQNPVSARSIALGGNTICIKDDDVMLAYQNPALLDASQHNKIGLSYNRWLSTYNSMFLTYAYNINKIGTFGASLYTLNYGKFSERDEYGVEIGTFSAADRNLQVMYSNKLDSNFSYGVTVKTIFANYANFKSFGVASDWGFTYKNKNQLVISTVLKNIGYQLKTFSGNTHEKLPFDWQIGISKKVKKAPFRLIMIYEKLNKWDLTYTDPANPPATVDPFTQEPIKVNKGKVFFDKLGRHLIFANEFVITKNFNLRLGFNYRHRKEMQLPDKRGAIGFSFGFGIKVSKFNFSYAFNKYAINASANTISLSTGIGDFKKKKVEG